MMAALKSTLLRDHLCWLWRMGSGSCDELLSAAALLSEQVLRILGVEHDSLDLMLCQVSAAEISYLAVLAHSALPFHSITQ